ncbi:MAG: hypothetical protein JO060_01510 [Candidatus Eremiobacteraeota bacterium]|nr:hypothetical protein [Candidatus Eremiobacteraeota bacterium]MBV9648021.1 hypothetical protein [Candidatus Eremiobacteraeota bacterium]
MSERSAHWVELASIVVIGVALLLFGWALLQNLRHFPIPAALLLLALAVFQIGSMRRNLSSDDAGSRVRATRDGAFLVAIVLALSELFAPRRWLIGACISSVEFGIVLEVLARVGGTRSAGEGG